MPLRAPRRLALAALVVLAVGAAPAAAQDQEKLGQTTMKFLGLSLDARAAALGDAVTAVEGMPTAFFYNPAGIARQESRVAIAAGQTQWLFGFDHNAAAISFAPAQGRFGVAGVTFQQVDYGDDFYETVVANNEEGYNDLGTFNVTAYAVGVGYAKALTDRFAVGGHVKYAATDLGDPVQSRGGDGGLVRDDAREGTLAYDFGVLYQTPLPSLKFAVSARNFSPEVTYVTQGAQLPLTLRIGLSMDVADLAGLDTRTHSLLTTADATNYRDYPEQLRFGAEYGFMDAVFLRGGYATDNGEQGATVGFGVQRAVRGVGFGADYAYTSFGDLSAFGRVHRLTLRFSL